MNIPTTFSALVFLFGTFSAINATTLNSTFNNDDKVAIVAVDDATTFYINGKDICIDEDFSIPITVSDFTMITSFQFTIGWDNSLVTFDTISYVSPILGNTLLFNDMSSDDGILTISWYDIDVAGVTVEDFTDLFHISFTTDAPNQTNVDVTFENEPTMQEVSGYVGNDIMLIDAVYNAGVVTVDQQELDTYEVINDVNDSNVGGVNITVKNGTAPYDYVWTNDAETQNLTNVGVGDYSVTVTDSKGCEEVFGPFTVDNTVNVNEISSLQSISLFPNPANDQTHLTAVFEQVEELEITIFNLLGERVFMEQREAASLDMDLEISNLSDGTYFLQLKAEAGIHTEKLEILR